MRAGFWERGVHLRAVTVLVICLLMLGRADVQAHPGIDDPEVAHLKEVIGRSFPGMSIEHFQPAPLPGLFMFTVGNQGTVMFIDKDAHYLLAQAALFDLSTQENLTQQFIMKVRRDLVGQIPLERAIVYGPAEEKRRADRTVYVFDDPDCPFCREFHKQIPGLVANGVTVAILLHPIERIHPGATAKATNIWCAANRNSAMDLAIGGNEVPAPTVPCTTSIDENIALAKRMGGGPTPYFVLPDGRAFAGAKSAREVMLWLGVEPPVAQQ